MENLLPVFGIGFVAVSLFAIAMVYKVLSLRRVVPTNEEHIVQSNKTTVSYGKATGNGNTYYEWPDWLPVFGINKVVLPVSNFEIVISDHKVYDKDRLPLNIDLTAFFRISNSNVAAQRASSFQEMEKQLKAMIESVAINIMATETVEGIMESRSELGHKFETEMVKYLPEWGVITVRNLAIKDVKDAEGSNAIMSITAKRKSAIDMESRQEVAKNKKTAEISEIEARREVDLQKQEATQTVGLRTVEANTKIQMANETASQSVQEQARATKEKQMAVLEVEHVKTAEINRKVQVTKAEQDKQTTVLAAEARYEAQLKEAEGKLQTELKSAEATKATGTAKAEAEKAMQLAPVQAQITLAKEIGENTGYQNYLITIKKVEAQQAVGIEQAKALSEANIKVIANSGSPAAGLNNVMDLFSAQGGTAVGSMLEGLANTETGQALLNTVGVKTNETNTKH